MLEEILFYLQKYRGRILGLVLGLLIGWLILHYGFLAAIFLLICIALGYVVGKRIDEEGWQEVLEKIFRKDR